MYVDWMKLDKEDYWSAKLDGYNLAAVGTMFRNFTYMVSDSAQVRKAGNVLTLEEAQAEAVRLARELDG